MWLSVTGGSILSPVSLFVLFVGLLLLLSLILVIAEAFSVWLWRLKK